MTTWNRRAPRGAIAVILLLASAGSGAQIYRCESATGVVEYSNARPAEGRKCRKIDLPSITTIPAPTSKPAAPGTSGKAFPRVDSKTQRARDDDRREILTEELRKEEQRLAALESEYKDGKPDRLGGERNYQRYLDRVERLKKDVERARSNVASLRRELSAIGR